MTEGGDNNPLSSSMPPPPSKSGWPPPSLQRDDDGGARGLCEEEAEAEAGPMSSISQPHPPPLEEERKVNLSVSLPPPLRLPTLPGERFPLSQNALDGT